MSMKHYIYKTLAIALSIVTSCTEHPIVQVPQVPESSRSYIFFEPEVLEAKTTKAEIVEGEELPGDAGTAFGVLGYYEGTSIFDGYGDGILFYNILGWEKLLVYCLAAIIGIPVTFLLLKYKICSFIL